MILSEDAETPVTRRRRVPTRRRRKKAARRGLVVGLGAVVLLGVLWLAITGLEARSALATVRDQVTLAQQAIQNGDAAGGEQHLQAAASAARAAHKHTDDAVWHLAGHLPFLGSDVRVISGLSSAADDLAMTGLPPLVTAGQQLLGSDLRSTAGVLDLTRVTGSAPLLTQASTSLIRVRNTVAGLPHASLGTVDSARTALLSRLDQLQGQVSRLQTAVAVAPGMLGAQGARTYFAGLENPAESRGTGGLVGTYAILNADAGSVSLVKVGSDTDLLSAKASVVDLGPDFDAQWRPFGADTIWPNANVSPDGPAAGATFTGLWKAQFGQQLDGMLLIDPVAAGYLLAATGPVTLSDGTVLDGSTAAAYLTTGIYAKYATDNDARKKVLEEVAHDVFGRLTAGSGVSQPALIKALVQGVTEGRVIVYSAHPTEQALLAPTTVSGALPSAPGPFAQLVVNNTAGNKLDAYLDRSVSYVAGACVGTTRSSTITATLTDDAPTSGLPAYVTGRLDLPAGQTVPVGEQRLFVSVYAAVGATVTSTTLNGQALVVRTDTEAGHTVVGAYVELPIGVPQTIVVTVTEPAVGGYRPYRPQPLLRDEKVSADVPACQP